jgi:hypothetical protein
VGYVKYLKGVAEPTIPHRDGSLRIAFPPSGSERPLEAAVCTQCSSTAPEICLSMYCCSSCDFRWQSSGAIQGPVTPARKEYLQQQDEQRSFVTRGVFGRFGGGWKNGP